MGEKLSKKQKLKRQNETLLSKEEIVNKAEFSIDNLIQLHLAEYNTLTARATNQMITVTIIFLGLLALFGTTITMLEKLNALVFWAIVFSAQIGAIIATWLSYEERNITLYIESDLRIKLISLIKRKDFWNYEDYLRLNRRKATSYILYPVFLLIIAIIVYVIRQRITTWSMIDWIGLGFNLVTSIILAYLVYLCFDIQKKMWIYQKKSSSPTSLPAESSR